MKKIIYILMFMFLINSAYAFNIKIDIKDSFTIDEKVYFNYTIISNTDQSISYLPHVNCPNAPVAFLQEKNIDLIANQPYTDTYYDIIIDDSIEPQTCTAYIQILFPTEQKVEKTFKIKTNPSFKFDIFLGKKIFILNEDININYNSEVENPTITSTLTYPNKKTKTISLPYSFKAKQLGTYNLEVTASKQGYKTITKNIQFGVIEKEANIPYVKPGKVTKEKKFPYSLIIILFLLIGIITTFIIYRSKIKTLLTLAKKHKIQPKDELTDLVNYIENMLEKGHAKEDIKQVLKEVGWEIKHIEEGFRRVR